MEYNFSELSVNTIEKTEKQLTSLKKKFVKELNLALGVIRNQVTDDQIDLISTKVSDAWNDEMNRQICMMTECMNKIQKSITSILNRG